MASRGARYYNFLHTIYCCLKYYDITNYHNIYTFVLQTFSM